MENGQHRDSVGVAPVIRRWQSRECAEQEPGRQLVKPRNRVSWGEVLAYLASQRSGANASFWVRCFDRKGREWKSRRRGHAGRLGRPLQQRLESELDSVLQLK